MMPEKPITRSKWLHVRLLPAEHERLQQQWRRTTCRKLSDYARRKLLDKPVTVLYRNQSLDAGMQEMIRLRQELARLGNNFNQAVRQLHTLQRLPEFSAWLLTWETERDLLQAKVSDIKHRINELADQWLL